MLRILEISWLMILIISISFGTWRWLTEGISSAIWFYLVALISSIAYGVRRKQRMAVEKRLNRVSEFTE